MIVANFGIKGMFVFLAVLTYELGHAFQLSRNDCITRRVKSSDATSGPLRSKNWLSMSSTAAGASSGNEKTAWNEITKPPQLVEFIEPKTKTKVILIGTMHYNPTSVNMVQNTLRKLADQNELGSVVVESCDIRWNTTMEILETPRGKFLEPILKSEMKAATDEALKYGRPCILGDQRINATGASLGQTFRQTFVEIVTPGGWSRLVGDFQQAAAVTFPTGEGYLNPTAILDPRLLIAAPVSFAKYPLSFLARNPLSTMVVFSLLGLLTYLDSVSGTGTTSFADATFGEQLKSIIFSIMFAAIEFGLFGRILVQVLLAERNEIIAKNILEQCKIYSPSNEGKKEEENDTNIMGFMASLFAGTRSKPTQTPADTKIQTMYVPGSIQQSGESDINSEEKVVVAVLGMAHCNGIVKLLKEELVI